MMTSSGSSHPLLLSTPVDWDALIERHAALVVATGLRVEPGDRLVVWAEGDVVDLARAVARHAFAAGADDVEVVWTDFELARARAGSGRNEVAAVVSPALGWMVEAVEQRASILWISSPPPEILDTAEAALLSRHLAAVEATRAPMRATLGSGSVCWCVTASPTQDWAARMYPGLDAKGGLESLRNALARTLRLDHTDPVTSWADHLADLQQRAADLTARSFDALRYRGPGTDLVVGLAESHRWVGGAAGRRGSCPNLPTEEVFTAPDRRRAEGSLALTKPAILDGEFVDGVQLELSDGEVVSASAENGETALHRFLDTDHGARRAGEVALVPQSSGVAAENLIWHHPLLDENDASHIALGAGIAMCLPDDLAGDEARRDSAGLNASSVHHDFVVGSDSLDVYGITARGDEEPLLLGGEWA